MVQDVLIRLLAAGGLIALAVMAAVLLRHSLDKFHTLLCRTPVGRRIVLGLFLAVCIAYGGSKNTSTVYNVRRLCANGTYTEWEYAAGNYDGTDAIDNPPTGGIYQV